MASIVETWFQSGSGRPALFGVIVWESKVRKWWAPLNSGVWAPTHLHKQDQMYIARLERGFGEKFLPQLIAPKIRLGVAGKATTLENERNFAAAGRLRLE